MKVSKCAADMMRACIRRKVNITHPNCKTEPLRRNQYFTITGWDEGEEAVFGRELSGEYWVRYERKVLGAPDHEYINAYWNIVDCALVRGGSVDELVAKIEAAE